MEDIFKQLDSDAISELFRLTAESEYAIVLVRESMHISNFNKAAAELTGLRTLDRVDQMLSEHAVHALRRCIADGAPQTVLEEVDGNDYRLEIIPNHGGALLVFQRSGLDSYNGSLRIMQAASIRDLSALLNDIGQVKDEALQKRMRKRAYRMIRTFNHNDLLHNLPTTEQLHLIHLDMTALCVQVIEHMQDRTECRIEFEATEEALLVGDVDMLKIALMNLLTNAVKNSAAGDIVTVSLTNDEDYVTISITNSAPPMDAELFRTLLYGWRLPMPLPSYLELTQKGVTLGFGLPLAQSIALLHGGTLLYSCETEQASAGNKIHFILGKLSPLLADDAAHAREIFTSPYSIEDIELSVLGE